MVSIFVRATSCLSCSESQVCAEQHGSPCSILCKHLFVRLYGDKSAQWFAMYFFQLTLNSSFLQIISDVLRISWFCDYTMDLVWHCWWGRSACRAIPLDLMPVLPEWLWPITSKHLFFSKGHSFSIPRAHMVSWTVWISLHIMIQIKCVCPSINVGRVWLTASQTGKQHWSEKGQSMDWSPWILSTIRSLMLAVAPHFPHWLPSRAQPAPDTGLRG